MLTVETFEFVLVAMAAADLETLFPKLYPALAQRSSSRTVELLDEARQRQRRGKVE